MSHDKEEIEELIQIIASYYPAAKQAIQVLQSIHKWARKLNYPINSLRDLTKQEHEVHISINEKHISLQAITGPIPSYYFPIASYENLIEKVNELYGIRTQQQVASPPSIPTPAIRPMPLRTMPPSRTMPPTPS